MAIFFKNRKPRSFNHQPILYNPEKEQRESNLTQRIIDVKREMGVLPPEDAPMRSDFKAEFVSQTHHLKKRKYREETGGQAFFANNRFLVILLIIIAVGFLFAWMSGLI